MGMKSPVCYSELKFLSRYVFLASDELLKGFGLSLGEIWHNVGVSAKWWVTQQQNDVHLLCSGNIYRLPRAGSLPEHERSFLHLLTRSSLVHHIRQVCAGVNTIQNLRRDSQRTPGFENHQLPFEPFFKREYLQNNLHKKSFIILFKLHFLKLIYK